MQTYTTRPTCGHTSLTYRSLRLAQAHAQAHADRSGAPVHVTSGSGLDNTLRHIDTMQPRTYGPHLPCHPTSPTDPMWEGA